MHKWINAFFTCFEHFNYRSGTDQGSGSTMHLHINLKAMFKEWKIRSSASLWNYPAPSRSPSLSLWAKRVKRRENNADGEKRNKGEERERGSLRICLISPSPSSHSWPEGKVPPRCNGHCTHLPVWINLLTHTHTRAHTHTHTQRKSRHISRPFAHWVQQPKFY